MPKLVDEIIETYRNYIGKEPKEYDTPGYPGQVLKKWTGDPVDTIEYRKIFGKGMYLVTKILPEGGNAARDLTKHFSNHWKSAGRMVGHLKKNKDKLKLTYRKPKELKALELRP